MTKLLSSIKNDEYRPTWFKDCEALEGTYDRDQDVLVDDQTGEIENQVFGVLNRPLAELYGLIKVLSQLLDDHHGDDGSHAIVDIDVAPDAAIQEALGKLLLDFYGMDIPEQIDGTYDSTSQLADKIAELYEYLAVLRKGLGSHIGHRIDVQLLVDQELGITGFTENPFSTFAASPRNMFTLLSDMQLWINGHLLYLRGTNEAVDSSSCHIPLSDPTKAIINDPEADVVWIEIYTESLTDSYVPYGNLQYGEDGSYQENTPPLTVDWIGAIVDNKNNLMMGSDLNLVQMQYKVVTSTFNPDTSDYGIDGAITSNGQVIVRSNVRGLWKAADDSCIVFPVVMIGKRNLGVYHKAVNPAGTAILRAGQTASDISECFDANRISYFSATSVECPDYMAAVYDSGEDTYELSGVIYYRSGTVISDMTSSPLGYYADMAYPNDVVYEGRQAFHDTTEAVSKLSEMILATDLYVKLNPVFKGLASSYSFGMARSRKPLQVVGFGDSENGMFGVANKGGVYIDKTNNDMEARIDGIRTYWADPTRDVPSSFTCIEGSDGSESKPIYLTYEPTTQVITINSTGLSGIPFISNIIPTLRWGDGSIVTLVEEWTGLGTSSARAVIDPSSHTGHKIHGVLYFTYASGSGIPFVLDDITKIEDMSGTSYDWCTQEVEGFCLECRWSGSPVSGTTTSAVLPECVVCADAETIVGGYFHVVEAATMGGEYTKIQSYDPDTKTVVFETPLSTGVSASIVATIGMLEPEKPTFVVNPYGRGVVGVFRRTRMIANSSGLAITDFPIHGSSEENVAGAMVTGLQADQYLEVIVSEEEPLTTGFYIYFSHNPQAVQFDPVAVSEMTVKNPGILVNTTRGSANCPFSLYRGFLPTSSTPVVDDTKWISGDCDVLDFEVSEVAHGTWFDIRPIEKLTLIVDGSVIRTEETQLSSFLTVKSDLTEELENHRMRMGTVLVETDIGYRLLVAFTNTGTFGFDQLSNCFLVDVDKIY